MIMVILWMIIIAIVVIILFLAWKERLDYKKVLEMEKESMDYLEDILSREKELLEKIEHTRDKISE